jgi:hypothetical protein
LSTGAPELHVKFFHHFAEKVDFSIALPRYALRALSRGRKQQKRMKFRLFSFELRIDLTDLKKFLSEEHEATTHLKMSFVGSLCVSNCSQFWLGVHNGGKCGFLANNLKQTTERLALGERVQRAS